MIIWRPAPEQVAQANLTHFMQVLARRGVAVSDYSALHAWSVAEPGAFWNELASFADVRADWGTGPVLTDAAQMPGARLNFAQNLLRHRDDQPALRRRRTHRTIRAPGACRRVR
jgi:acetoacetyl-CoA synthetase